VRQLAECFLILGNVTGHFHVTGYVLISLHDAIETVELHIA